MCITDFPRLQHAKPQSVLPGFPQPRPTAAGVLYKHAAHCPSFSGMEKAHLQNHPKILGERLQNTEAEAGRGRATGPRALPVRLGGTEHPGPHTLGAALTAGTGRGHGSHWNGATESVTREKMCSHDGDAVTKTKKR